MKGMSKAELIAFLNHAYPDENQLVLEDTMYEIFITYGDDYYLDGNYQFNCAGQNRNKIAALGRMGGAGNAINC